MRSLAIASALIFLIPSVTAQLFVPMPMRETEATKLIASENGWESEVVMPDGSRCDLVTPDHAIEVEWSEKWKEAPAQAVLYSIWTGKRPGIMLLVSDRQASRVDVLRCKLVCERLGIDVWIRSVKGVTP